MENKSPQGLFLKHDRRARSEVDFETARRNNAIPQSIDKDFPIFSKLNVQPNAYANYRHAYYDDNMTPYAGASGLRPYTGAQSMPQARYQFADPRFSNFSASRAGSYQSLVAPTANHTAPSYASSEASSFARGGAKAKAGAAKHNLASRFTPRPQNRIYPTGRVPPQTDNRPSPFDGKRPWYKRKMCMLSAGIIGLIFIALIVLTIVFGVKAYRNSSSGAASGPQGPTNKITIAFPFGYSNRTLSKGEISKGSNIPPPLEGKLKITFSFPIAHLDEKDNSRLDAMHNRLITAITDVIMGFNDGRTTFAFQQYSDESTQRLIDNLDFATALRDLNSIVSKTVLGVQPSQHSELSGPGENPQESAEFVMTFAFNIAHNDGKARMKRSPADVTANAPQECQIMSAAIDKYKGKSVAFIYEIYASGINPPAIDCTDAKNALEKLKTVCALELPSGNPSLAGDPDDFKKDMSSASANMAKFAKDLKSTSAQSSLVIIADAQSASYFANVSDVGLVNTSGRSVDEIMSSLSSEMPVIENSATSSTPPSPPDGRSSTTTHGGSPPSVTIPSSNTTQPSDGTTHSIGTITPEPPTAPSGGIPSTSTHGPTPPPPPPQTNTTIPILRNY
ncbi:unnamed protein product, partial [Anisakis simplex]|uniref:VWFA domain-containing protein n=1 Tax=Anisakis simplex TaxID=6269 RepID=A0A0M3K7T8_ANISI